MGSRVDAQDYDALRLEDVGSPTLGQVVAALCATGDRYADDFERWLEKRRKAE